MEHNNWNAELSRAYNYGLEDGRAGLKRGSPNDFHAAYEQGYAHGREQRVAGTLLGYDMARRNMAECLKA